MSAYGNGKAILKDRNVMASMMRYLANTEEFTYQRLRARMFYTNGQRVISYKRGDQRVGRPQFSGTGTNQSTE